MIVMFIVKFLWVIGTTLVFILGYVMARARSSEGRAFAEQNPGTILYYAVKILDWIDKNTIKRSISLKNLIYNGPTGTPSPQETFVHRLHDYLGIDNVFEIRHAFSVTIDFSKLISDKSLSLLGHPAAHLLLQLALAFIVYLFVVVPPVYFSGVSLQPAIALLASGVILVFGFAIAIHAMTLLDDGVFGSLQKLYYQPYVIIIIDAKMITIITSGKKTVARNNGGKRFEKITRDFTLGIALTGNGEDVIVSYPRILCDILSNEDELMRICSELNSHMERIRAEKPIEGGSAAAEG